MHPTHPFLNSPTTTEPALPAHIDTPSKYRAWLGAQGRVSFTTRLTLEAVLALHDRFAGLTGSEAGLAAEVLSSPRFLAVR